MKEMNKQVTSHLITRIGVITYYKTRSERNLLRIIIVSILFVYNSLGLLYINKLTYAVYWNSRLNCNFVILMQTQNILKLLNAEVTRKTVTLP